MDYHSSAHRIQTAIAVLMGRDPTYAATDPKHLRVGIDLSKAEQAGLARLLIAKGVFTEAEYVASIEDAVREEAASYEKQVQGVLGNRNIRTG